jgi:hypothetical protein
LELKTIFGYVTYYDSYLKSKYVNGYFSPRNYNDNGG